MVNGKSRHVTKIWLDSTDLCRTSYSTLTFRKPDFRLLKDIHDIFIEEANSFSSHDKTMFSLANNLLVGLTISIVSKDEIFHMGKNGGNPLGLQVKDAPLMSTYFLDIFPLGTLFMTSFIDSLF